MTIALEGEYDLARTTELRHALLDIDVRSPHVVVDLSEVTFVDSSGLRTLLDIKRTLDAEGGSVRLAAVPPQVERLFVVTDKAHLFGLDPAGV